MTRTDFDRTYFVWLEFSTGHQLELSASQSHLVLCSLRDRLPPSSTVEFPSCIGSGRAQPNSTGQHLLDRCYHQQPWLVSRPPHVLHAPKAQCARPKCGALQPQDDPDLEAIRQRRMQELMAQQGGGQVRLPADAALCLRTELAGVATHSAGASSRMHDMAGVNHTGSCHRNGFIMQGGQPMTQEQQAEQAAEREEADMQRQGMLAAIMQPSARERCASRCQLVADAPRVLHSPVGAAAG